MTVETIQHRDLIEFLRARAVFQDLTEGQLVSIAGRMDEYRLSAGRDLFRHKDAGYTFYFIYDGSVRIWRSDGGQELEFAVMESGDKFGEESLLYRRPRSATVTTLKNSHFLTLDIKDFKWMLSTYPQIKGRMLEIAQSHEKTRRQDFNWLFPDEYIHLISQRHEFELWDDLWRPGLVFLLGLIIIGLSTPFIATTFLAGSSQILFGTGAVIALFSILWLLWEYFDWNNDFFIITNQRVVWLEKVIMFSDSRQESPMSAIQSVSVTNNQWGRSFGFGNIEIRTYTGTGSMTLTNVKDPEHFKRQIEELIIRIRSKSQAAESDSMRFSIRSRLGMAAVEDAIDTAVGLLEPDKLKEKGLGVFTTRDVDANETITYHKHPWVLLTKIFWAVLGLIGVGAGLLYLFWRDFTSTEPVVPSMNIVLGVGIPAALTIAIYIWYHYEDYSNDLYQVTRDTITDRDRKPFGDEETRSAPLRNVLSINYSRDGLINNMLNMGDVHIIVADETLTFDNVSNPAHIQQDIFYRLERLKHTEAEAKRDRESADMLKWIQIYHEVVQEQEDDDDEDFWGDDEPEE